MRHGECQFRNTSISACALFPLNGDRLIINGAERTIPLAGVAMPSLAASDTRYFIYAYWTGSAIALEASTTGYTLGTGGIVCKIGDITRTLVGQAYASSSFGFSQSGNGWTVRSWFNDKPPALNTYNSGVVDLSGGIQGPLATINLLAWDDDAVDLLFSFTGAPLSAPNTYYIFGYINGGQIASTSQSDNTGYYATPVAAWKGPIGGGYHSLSVYGQNASGTDWIRCNGFKVQLLVSPISR